MTPMVYIHLYICQQMAARNFGENMQYARWNVHASLFGTPLESMPPLLFLKTNVLCTNNCEEQ